MVIQPNMTISSICEIWPETKQIFEENTILFSCKHTIEEVVSGNQLHTLLEILNNTIGSSNSTCIEGG